MTKIWWQVRTGTLAMAAVAVMACAREPLTGISDTPALAKGGKPGGSGTPLLPLVKLTDPRTLGCSSAMPRDINSGATVRVAGYANCGGVMRLFTWTGSLGASLIGDASVNGIVEGVADDQTMVGNLRAPGPPAFVILGGASPIAALPLPGEYLYASATAVSANGQFAVGNGSKLNPGFVDCRTLNACVYHTLLWTRSGDSWSGPEVVATGGSAAAVTNDGDLVIGASGGHAVIWTRGTPWQGLSLPELTPTETVAFGSSAEAINGQGDVIAGYRVLPLQRDPTIQYEEHAVWRFDGASWKVEPLKGYNIAEGRAYDVADFNGRTVVVGFSWDDTKGRGGTQWPTYWTWDRNVAHPFAPPQRLSQLSERWGASATAVNSLGQIVGDSWTGSLAVAFYPVMWQLPPQWP